MKILNFKLIIVQSLFLIWIGHLNFHAQSTVASNLYAGGRFLGWNNTNGTNPLYFKTNDAFRMKLNATVSYGVNGYNTTDLGRDGYLLLGRQLGGAEDLYTPNTLGAYSLLHLSGNSAFGAGYKPWMKTGITFTDNGDLSYFGLRAVNNEWDVTETVIAWSNDPSNLHTPPYGPDDMVFRFTNGVATNGSSSDPAAQYNTDIRDNTDIDGRHVARFTGEGRLALGNTFGINRGTTIYVRPKSLYHMSSSHLDSTWMQFTNRNVAPLSGTGENTTDGMRIGIIGSSNPNINGYAAMYNQEDRPILFSTGNGASTSINVSAGSTGERMRIMHINAPTTISSGSVGVYNPASLASNITRMSVSHNPTTPVTRPMSLLHLGYNTTSNTNTDGWRTWMDVGMFVSNSSDHVYLGLKNEGTNRQDAVIGWGDEQTGTNGPDNLRFIFSSSATGGVSPANTANGLEVARMVPNTASTLTAPNAGMMGVGNFSPTGPNSALADQVDAKVDIDGDLRIRTVTPDNNLTQVLVIDPTDKNRVHYRDASTLTGVGNYCSATSNPLTDFYQIPLNDYDYHFEGQGGDHNSVGIGYTCPNTLRGKLHVYNTHKEFAGYFETILPQSSVGNAANGLFVKAAGYTPSNATGVRVITETLNSSVNYGVNIDTYNGTNNYGIYSTVPTGTGNYAGYFDGDVLVTGTATILSDQMFKTDVAEISDALTIVKALNPKSYYLDTVQFNNRMSLSSKLQYGFIAQEVEATNPEIVGKGIHPAKYDSLGQVVSPSFDYKTVNYNAIIPINTQAIKELNLKVDKQTLSDQSIKTNVQDLNGSLNKVLAMRGVSFNWNQNLVPEYELDNSEHVGFIAQEINAVDSRLTFISDENLMHVDYNKIVPIAVEAIQELNGQIAQRDSIINSLNARLTQLENCLSGILPFLCQISHNSIQPTQQEFQQQLNKEIDVQLSNRGTIILNQNVPNPFAEQTQISFSIPETVKKAQIHFYDANGKLINSVEIQERGLGQLNVFANDLSTGMYTYTLVADGQIVATKKMMKQ